MTDARAVTMDDSRESAEAVRAIRSQLWAASCPFTMGSSHPKTPHVYPDLPHETGLEVKLPAIVQRTPMSGYVD